MQPSKIEKIEPSSYKGKVYNIEVEEDNSYVTEGFVVHNCDPSKADESFFERIRVDNDIGACKQPHRESAGVRYWGDYIPHHAFGIGADTSEGIGKDANTMAVWDFGVHENDVATLVATYFNNNIAPDLFGHELMRVGGEFGNCIVAPEANNTGHATLGAMRGYPNIYAQTDEASSRQVKYTEKLGWRTTRKTKPQMFFEFRKDYNDGLIKIYDKNVLKEMRSYTSMDLTDTKHGMVTRHFDLLISCIIGYQMRKHATIDYFEEDVPVEDEMAFPDIGL